MFGVDASEFLIIAIVALVVIGPKDLPKAMRFVGYWIGRARGVSRQFRAGFDEMVRETELAEMEKSWKAENERIMREHQAASPNPGDNVDLAYSAPDRPDTLEQAALHGPDAAEDPSPESGPAMVEKPHVTSTGSLDPDKTTAL